MRFVVVIVGGIAVVTLVAISVIYVVPRPAPASPTAASAAPGTARPEAVPTSSSAAPARAGAPTHAAASAATPTKPSPPGERPQPEETPPTTGTLHVDADVPGATVFFDRIGRGPAPLTIRDIDPGTHQLTVNTPDDRYSETITVDAGERTISVTFKKADRGEARIDVVHQHGIGSCKGRLVATGEGLRYEAENGKDNFSLTWSDVASWQVDAIGNTVQVRSAGGRKYDFADRDGNITRLDGFGRDVARLRRAP